MEFIDWQPGNGSRYPIAFYKHNLDGHLTWMVTWLMHSDVSGPSFKWSGNRVDLDYMADKMGIRGPDALPPNCTGRNGAGSTGLRSLGLTNSS